MRLHRGWIFAMLVAGATACAKSGNDAARKAQEQTPAPGGEAAGAVAAPEAAAVKLAVEDSALLARASVTDEVARAAALERVPGGHITAAELEEEDGLLIYSYDVNVDGQEGVQEVHVDATTGKVVKMEHESSEEGGL